MDEAAMSNLMHITQCAVIFIANIQERFTSNPSFQRPSPFLTYSFQEFKLAARSLANGRVRRPMPSGLDSLSGVTFGTSKRLDPLSGGALGHQKRNFDKFDRLSLNSFVKKNFDEIDRTGFDSFVKRNFNEIDSTGFDNFIKRNAPALLWRYYRNHNH